MDDMREVGRRSGITTKDDIPVSIGYVECRRWARRFGVRPFEDPPGRAQSRNKVVAELISHRV